MKVHIAASLIYGLFAFAPLLQWSVCAEIPRWTKSPLGFAWALVVSLAFPAWLWQETRVFEAWVRDQDATRRPIERAYFKLMTDLAKNFWTAVLAVYTIAGIWSLQTKAPEQPKPLQPIAREDARSG